MESSYYVKYFLHFVHLVVQHLGQAWLCKYAGFAQRGCKQRPAQCAPAHGCKQGSTQCAHGCKLFLRHKRTTDCAEVRMTSANRDTLCATMTRFVAVYGVGPHRGVCKVWRMIVEPAATTDHHDAPTLCRRTPNLRHPAHSNAGHTRCKQDPRHGIYSKLVTSIWSQQPWQHLYQSWRCTILLSAEKYPRGRNWMQRHRGDYSNEQTGNEARGSLPKLC